MQPPDPSSLPNDQYKTDQNLSARVRLHQKYSKNPYGWCKWVFDRLALPAQARILEIACGRGDLWAENMQRIPDGWDITLTDASPGMLASAMERLAAAPRPFHFQQAFINEIPFKAGQFDAVIANHMLYYVEDKPGAFREVLRVLKPGGTFFTSTVGAKHMREMAEKAAQYLEPGQANDVDSSRLSFLLEDGAAQLEPFFQGVEMYRYEDSLFVTEVEPLVQYITSMRRSGQIRGHDQEIRAFIEQEIRAKGGIFIYKDSGIFIARKGG